MPTRIHDGLKKRCACAPRKWPKCQHPWHFSLHYNGREHRFSLDVVAAARGASRPRSKADAVVWRDRLRAEIRAAGRLGSEAPQLAPKPWSFGSVCDEYLRRHVRAPTRRPRARREMELLVALARRAEVTRPDGLVVRLESRPVTEITRGEIEGVRAWRRREQAEGRSRPGCKGGAVGINRLLSRVRHIFSWAVGEEYCETTPFKRAGVTVIKLETVAETPRTRRLELSRQAAILAHSGFIRAILVAALTTGCRIGELLSLLWQDVRRDDRGEYRWIAIRAANSKTSKPRVIPIGSRLRAELELRRRGPDGEELPPTAHVFGNEVGERLKSIRRPWEDAVLRAYGHDVTRKRGKFTPESQRVFRGIDLHVHDLRREFGSSLLESGAGLHDVASFLGQANITTTSRYLESAPVRLEQALMRMEQGSEGFAHHSHTRDSEAPSEPPNPSVGTTVNLLN